MHTASQASPPILAVALACAVGSAFSACEQTAIDPPDQTLALPALSLIRRGPQTLELRIASPDGLRALQAKLRYDSAALRVTKIEAGREAAGLDRLFFSDLKRAKGTIVVGLADTRNVRLPARGSLWLITFALNAPGAGQTKLTLEAIVGVRQPAIRLSLPAQTLELKL